MSKDFEIIQWTLDEAKLQAFTPQLRNQLFACMHAHNELTTFNRLLMFSTTAFGEGELHNSALSVQMWSMLQVLAGKLVETWNMLDERFLRANPTDPAIASLSADHKKSLQWLIDYFGTGKNKTDNPLRFVRDKTAFHPFEIEWHRRHLDYGEAQSIVPGSPSLPLSATDRGRASCRHSRVVADFGIGSLNPLHDSPARIEHAGEIRSRIASETTYGGWAGGHATTSRTQSPGREDRRRSRSPMSVEEVGFARDSPLEGAKFEPSVPRRSWSAFRLTPILVGARR